MKILNKNNDHNMKILLFIIFLLYLSLLSGFWLSEDSTGGAYWDYLAQKTIPKAFNLNFYDTLINYPVFETRHSPIFHILFSIFYKFNFSDFLIRIINLHICLFIPIIFYKCLEEKYKEIDRNYLIIFVGIIFLSPTFRSLAVWPDSRLFGLLFFLISIYFFLKFKKEKKFLNSLKCTFAYTISSYISPNFAVFSIFYFYFFFIEFRISKEIFLLLILNIFLSIPAFFYLSILETNFLFFNAVPKQFDNLPTFNFSNKILIISTFIFFYITPFILTKSIKIDFLKIKPIIFSMLLLLVLVPFFNYGIDYTGGGIIFKISNIFLKSNIFFYATAFLALIIIFNLFKIDKRNILLILLLVLNNPQLSIYHKYYDPLLIVLFMLLFELKLEKKIIFNYKIIGFFYIYFFLFLIVNWIK